MTTITHLCIGFVALVLLCIALLVAAYLLTKIIEQSVELILQWLEDREKKK